MPRPPILFIAATLLCGAQHPEVPPIYLAPDLAPPAGTTAGEWSTRPLEDPLPLKIATPEGTRLTVATTCGELLSPAGEVVGSESDAAYRVVVSERVRCQALSLAARVKPATQSAVPEPLATERATALFPAGLWPSPSSSDPPPSTVRTLSDSSGKRRWEVISPRAMSLKGADFSVTLTEWIGGDLNGDGWYDLVVMWRASSLEGTWTDTRLWVLTRRSTSAPLVEVGAQELR